MSYDGEIRFCTKIDNSQVAKDLKRVENEIRKAHDSINKNENAKLPLAKQAEALKAKIAEAKAEIQGLEDSLQKFNSFGKNGEFIPEGTAKKIKYMQEAIPKSIAEQRATLATLEKQWESVSSKIEKYDRAIQQANADIERNKAKAAELSIQMKADNGKMAAVFALVRKSAEKFKNQIVRIGASMIMFRVFLPVLQGVGAYLNKALKTNEEYTAQLAQLKGALLTAFQPIYEFALPGLLAVLKVLTSIVQVVANVLSALTGKTSAQSAKNAKALKEEADALDSVGSAAQKAQNNLAGFDEINTLGTADVGSGAGGSTSVTAPDFGTFDTAEYQARIDELTVYMSGALLALGAILTFSGANIPLGIGLMVMGAAGIASVVKVNWDSMSKTLKSAVTKVLTVLGAAALALGAILVFSGVSVPKGIALMALGAASLVAAAALNWDYLTDNVDGVVATLELLLGSAVLAIGAILAFSGTNLPLGIAMIAAGAYAIHEAADLNWDSMSKTLRGPIGKVVALASGALLALGAILAFSGVNLMLGIALIAAGAAGLVTTTAANWDKVKSTLQGPVGKVVAIACGALLALGLILAFSGVNLPLGIALIAAGAAGLVTVGTLNWNSIRDKLKEVWAGIKQWFDTNVKPKLTLTYWKEKFTNIGDALVQKIKDGINSGITLFNKFISWINSKMKFSWGDFSILGEKVIEAGSFQLFSIPSIPALAQGAVLPANKPFLAMVGDQKNGTNVEAPLETIKQALAEVMAMQGTGDININFTGDLAALARVLKPVIDKENRRVGGSLIQGVT